MNKRGQEEFVSWEFVKGVVLVILIVILSGWAYRGIPDSKLNPLKAEDLSLTISSIFLVEGDLNLAYDLGDEYYVDIDDSIIRLSRSEEGMKGRGEIFLDGNYNFGEQLNGKTELINIKKEGSRVVIS
ncbi:hypothetical protein J4443_03490 [Candidatus Woesearchaeota archaeon]|nr:hypothetical protein [Candidatus Woesearchaeota archaeon]